MIIVGFASEKRYKFRKICIWSAVRKMVYQNQTSVDPKSIFDQICIGICRPTFLKYLNNTLNLDRPMAANRPLMVGRCSRVAQLLCPDKAICVITKSPSDKHQIHRLHNTPSRSLTFALTQLYYVYIFKVKSNVFRVIVFCQRCQR